MLLCAVPILFGLTHSSEIFPAARRSPVCQFRHNAGRDVCLCQRQLVLSTEMFGWLKPMKSSLQFIHFTITLGLACCTGCNTMIDVSVLSPQKCSAMHSSITLFYKTFFFWRLAGGRGGKLANASCHEKLACFHDDCLQPTQALRHGRRI